MVRPKYRYAIVSGAAVLSGMEYKTLWAAKAALSKFGDEPRAEIERRHTLPGGGSVYERMRRANWSIYRHYDAEPSDLSYWDPWRAKTPKINMDEQTGFIMREAFNAMAEAYTRNTRWAVIAKAVDEMGFRLEKKQ